MILITLIASIFVSYGMYYQLLRLKNISKIGKTKYFLQWKLNIISNMLLQFSTWSEMHYMLLMMVGCDIFIQMSHFLETKNFIGLRYIISGFKEINTSTGFHG